MIKREELTNPSSCLNRAADDEPIFVLRAHDQCAVATVLAWANYRIECGKSTKGSPEIVEAYRWCNVVAMWRKERE